MKKYLDTFCFPFTSKQTFLRPLFKRYRKENKNFFVFSLSEVVERINFNDSEQVVQVMSFQFQPKNNENRGAPFCSRLTLFETILCKQTRINLGFFLFYFIVLYL